MPPHPPPRPENCLFTLPTDRSDDNTNPGPDRPPGRTRPRTDAPPTVPSFSDNTLVAHRLEPNVIRIRDRRRPDPRAPSPLASGSYPNSPEAAPPYRRCPTIPTRQATTTAPAIHPCVRPAERAATQRPQAPATESGDEDESTRPRRRTETYVEDPGSDQAPRDRIGRPESEPLGIHQSKTTMMTSRNRWNRSRVIHEGGADGSASDACDASISFSRRNRCSLVACIT